MDVSGRVESGTETEQLPRSTRETFLLQPSSDSFLVFSVLITKYSRHHCFFVTNEDCMNEPDKDRDQEKWSEGSKQERDAKKNHNHP